MIQLDANLEKSYQMNSLLLFRNNTIEILGMSSRAILFLMFFLYRLYQIIDNNFKAKKANNILILTKEVESKKSKWK